jgi:hypothetical protein
MAKLLNKCRAPVEFLHGGKEIKLPPNKVVEVDDGFLMELAKYDVVNAYFDQGKVELVEGPKAPVPPEPAAEPEAPAKPAKKAKQPKAKAPEQEPAIITAENVRD